MNVLEQQLKRLGEDEAAQVIRRALEIQGEPGTVSLDELRQVATELRIDPDALEKALAERLADQPQHAPGGAAGEIVTLYRTEMERSWQGGASASHIEALLTAIGGGKAMWATPIGQRSVWTSKTALGPGYGEISVVQANGVTTLSAKAYNWPAVLTGFVTFPIWLGIVSKLIADRYFYGGPSPENLFFTLVAASLTALLCRGFARRAAKLKLVAIEASLKGAARK